MTAAATLRALEQGDRLVGRPGQPLVRIDGVIRSDLFVQSLTCEGPLDRRRAVLAVAPADRASVDRLVHARIELLLPVHLAGADGDVVPLMAGRLGEVRRRLGGRTAQGRLAATCDWTTRLAQRVVLPEAPRSLGALLEQANAQGRLELTWPWLEDETLDRPITRSMPRQATLGAMLEHLADEFDLVIHREFQWHGHGVTEHRVVRSHRQGRPIALAATDAANPAGVLAALDASEPLARPIRLVARADGQVVESTFDLRAGWDDTRQGLADHEYVRSTSGDFDFVRNVYRLWRLNEDGALGDPPFDLTALFDEGRAIAPQALRFGSALTRDDRGRTVGVVVEASIDRGQIWTRYAGRVEVLADRAGLYLDDDALPEDFFSAAKAGEARLRVTGTLRSPEPLARIRWVGNPFAGSFETRMIEVGDAFEHRRVAPTSRYHDAVRDGEMTADHCDQRPAMDQWLARRAVGRTHEADRLTVTTARIMDGLRLGDRLIAVGRRTRLPRGLRLHEITHDWTTHRSDLTWTTGEGAT